MKEQLQDPAVLHRIRLDGRKASENLANSLSAKRVKCHNVTHRKLRFFKADILSISLNYILSMIAFAAGAAAVSMHS